MRGWTVQINRKALALALWQPAALIAFVAVVGLFIPRAAFDEFLCIAGAIIGVFLVVCACQFIGAGAQVAVRTRGAASQAEDPPARSWQHQQRQLGSPHEAAGSSQTDGQSA